jgi:hypothetical protein
LLHRDKKKKQKLEAGLLQMNRTFLSLQAVIT